MSDSQHTPSLSISNDARVFLQNEIRDYTSEFFERETRRRKHLSLIFAGINIIGLVAFIGSIWAAANWYVERVAEKSVTTSKIIESQVQAIAKSAVDATKQLAEVQTSLDKALAGAESATQLAKNAISAADRMRNEASAELQRFKNAMQQAGDAELLSGFERLRQLASKVTETEADTLQKALRADSHAYISKCVFSILPIGSIIAWHKNPAAKPDGSDPGKALSLPVGWMECNGDPIPIELDSPLSIVGATHVPNLNGDERFLRGRDVSGRLQRSAVGSHQHESEHGLEYLARRKDGRLGAGFSRSSGEGDFIQTSEWTGDVIGDHSETRPVNMSVVWIIRVK